METQSSTSTVKDEPMEDSAAIPDGIAHATNGDDIEMGDAQDQAVKNEVKLEDLFADVDSDEEFPSSAPVVKQLSSSPEEAALPT